MAAKTTPAEIAAEIRAYCKKHADPAVAAKYSRFFKEGYDAYGVPDDAYRQEKRRIQETYGIQLGLRGSLDLGDLLLASGKYEEGWFAISLAASAAPSFRTATLKRFAAWFDRGIRNWAHADVMAGEVLSTFFERGVADLKAFGDWRRAPSKWRRRAVPVTMLTLLKMERGVGPLLRFIKPMMRDEERVVQQGLGWFLREAWKRAPEPVEKFLEQYKDTAPRLIFQYATEKMTAATKARFRRSKDSEKGKARPPSRRP